MSPLPSGWLFQQPAKPCSGERANFGVVLQPVVKVWLHSTGDASPPAALLLTQILPVFSVVAPCRRGASPVSVRRQTFTTGCYGIGSIRGISASTGSSDSSRRPRASCTERSGYRRPAEP